MTVTWEVAVAERNGNLIANVPTAKVPNHKRILNDVDYAIVEVDLFDEGFLAYGLDQDIVLAYEARLKRNGVTKLVGPWLSLGADLDTNKARFLVVSWWWYFTRRYFGDANRTSYVFNGGFEASPYLSGWTTFGAVTTYPEGVIVNEGNQALIMDAAANNTSGITQTFAPISHTFRPSLAFFFSAAVNITTTSTVDDDTVLMWLTATAPGREDINEVITWENRVILGEYSRIDGFMILPGGPTWTITARYFAVNGRIRWDSIKAFFQDSTTVQYPGDDQSVLVTQILQHAQAAAFGKSNLLVGISAAATGVRFLLGYEHYLHENIADAVVALTQLVDGFDFHCNYDTRTWVLDYPRRGGVKPRWRIGTDRNVVTGGSLEVDGSVVENWHVVMGDPVWSEEGGAVDAADLGGLTLEGVSRAPVGYQLRQLPKLAQERVRQRKRRVLNVSVKLNQAAGDFAGNVEPGDTIPVGFQRGWLDIDEDLRIVAIEEEGELVHCSFAPVDSSGS